MNLYIDWTTFFLCFYAKGCSSLEQQQLEVHKLDIKDLIKITVLKRFSFKTWEHETYANYVEVMLDQPHNTLGNVGGGVYRMNNEAG